MRWNIGNTTSGSYFLLLTTTYTSLCFMLWLVATPLKSASARSDAQAWNWDSPKAVLEASFEREIQHSERGKMREDEIFKKNKKMEQSRFGRNEGLFWGHQGGFEAPKSGTPPRRNLHAQPHMGGMTQRLPLKNNETCGLPSKKDPQARLQSSMGCIII